MKKTEKLHHYREARSRLQIFQIVDRFLPRRLQIKLSLLVTGLLIFLVSLVGALFSESAEKLLQDQIGQKAIDTATAIALNDLIISGVKTSDPDSVQPIAEKIRISIGAEFVVVGDANGIRLSHPDPERIGKKFVGGDENDALVRGKSYISQATGTLGPSLRGIVPVHDGDGSVIGFVAVGYLTSSIERQILAKQLDILKYVGIVLIFGIFGATLIARGMKSAILGLEPDEIAALFRERNAIISAIRAGILAVDNKGRLTVVNQAARKYLGQPEGIHLQGRPLFEICDSRELENILENREELVDAEIVINEQLMIVNVMPLDDTGAGLVITFRPKDELHRLTKELSHVQEYTGLLRAQTHEYSNKLHTIAGLLQLGAHQEALELIMTEAGGYQKLIRTLSETVPDPVLAGVILGKYNRACELKIDLEFDQQNSFIQLPAALDRELLVTIIGNMLDNAFEAVAAEKKEPRTVRLYLTDLGPDLIIEVEDSGPGIAQDMLETMFQAGVTTKKGQGRGMGLHLVRRAVNRLGGQIILGDGELGGSIFTVILPKKHCTV